MPTDHNIRQLVINKMTDAQYEQAVKNADELYLTPYSGEGGGTDLPDQTGQSGKFLTTNGSTLSWANVPEGTVTSVRVQATSPVQSSTSTAQSSTLNTTISLANGYGDTKNPYGTKNVNYVLAGPSSGSAAEPTFRALVKEDIPLASEIATSGGTTTSLVTTGEKYIWDNKQVHKFFNKCRFASSYRTYNAYVDIPARTLGDILINIVISHNFSSTLCTFGTLYAEQYIFMKSNDIF